VPDGPKMGRRPLLSPYFEASTCLQQAVARVFPCFTVNKGLRKPAFDAVSQPNPDQNGKEPPGLGAPAASNVSCSKSVEETQDRLISPARQRERSDRQLLLGLQGG
jgi:hypothetical protein